MSDLMILGTDTDAGKTTFALLWLGAFADCFEYWKPVETGPSDCQRVAQLLPRARVHPVSQRFNRPLAPPLSARLEGSLVLSASVLAAQRPKPAKPTHSLLIETFGGPFSPLNENELQIALIKKMDCTNILVSSSKLGAVGRTLSCLKALGLHGIIPRAVVLLGPRDDYAAEQIFRHGGEIPVFSLQPPNAMDSPVADAPSPSIWDSDLVHRAAGEQMAVLQSIFQAIESDKPTPVLHAGLELVARDRISLWHPYTSLREPDAPLVCVGAQDEYLFLADGRKIIDGISSWWTILHGHRFPPLIQALHGASEKFDHVLFAGVTHEPAIELAELLLATAPWSAYAKGNSGGRVFYSDNGSTAVEVAIKMAYQYWCHQGQPERKKFVGFQHGYHGDTFGAMAVSRDPVFFGRFEPLLFQAQIVPLAPDLLDEFLSRHRNETAAVIVEPLVQGAGGMRMHSAATLKQLFEVTKNHDVLFIADEVMTGGGRTGWLWAHQAAGIAPDLICAAKTLTGGVLPLAATLAAPHIVAAFDTAEMDRTFFHGHSFTAHPLACAVALANWKLLTKTFRFPGKAPSRPGFELPGKIMENHWHKSLAILRDQKNVREVRICGTIAAVELAVSGGYLSQIGRQVRRCCLEDGVFLRPLGNVVYALPPLCTSPQSLDQIAQAIIRAVHELPK